MAKRRGLQKRAAEALAALGFTAITGTNFTRRSGEQLHLVNLQYRKFCSEITFNIGCHFVGVPTWVIDERVFRPVTEEKMEWLNCGLLTRLDCYVGDGKRPMWWNPDNSEVPEVLEIACKAVTKAFAFCEKTWGDGSPILASHVKLRPRSCWFSAPLSRWSLCMQDDTLGFLALLAHHHGDNELAKALYQRMFAREYPPPPYLAEGVAKVIGM